MMSVAKQVWMVWQTVPFHLNSWNTYAVHEVHSTSWFLSLSFISVLSSCSWKKPVIVRSVIFSHSPALGFSTALEALPCEVQSQEVDGQECQGSEQVEMETLEKVQIVLYII